jgi:hypothetical protein
MLLSGCLLAASAAMADDIGFVDCSSRSEATEVFGKPRKSQDIVATVPCGERFVIVTYGFIFSRIQTRAGQVGYVFSSLISVDRASASLPAAPAAAAPSIQMASEKTKVPGTPKSVAPPKPSTPPADPQPPAAQAQVAATQASAATPVTQDVLVASPLPNSAPAQPQLPVPDSASSAAPAAPPASVPTTKSDADAKPTSDVKPSTTQLEAQAEAALASAAPTTTSAPSQPAATPASDAMPKAPEPAATPAPVAAQPDPQPAAPAQPEAAASAPAEPAPAPAPIRASERTTWEKPLPSARKTALFEFYGGYSYIRTAATSSLSANNMGGVVGSVAWNFKSWLQFVGDTSYSEVTGTGSKNILYGNHFGARYLYRNRNRYGLTPFVEGMVGGSRSDISISGASGYTTSANCISYKVGGGVDFHPMRHIDVRVFDVDYYRTSFGSSQQQNNYTASIGIVIHLFGGGEQ